MVVEGFRVFVGDTVTGRIAADLPASSLGWGLRLNAAGSVDASLPVVSRETARLDLRTLTTPLRCFLGCSYNGTVLEAGPIWSRSYTPKDNTLRLGASGIWSILDRRKALPGTALLPNAQVTRALIQLRNLTLGSIGRELVRISIEDNPYGAGLNITLPPLESGIHERNYHGYDLGWVGERLRQLTGVQDGPDIRFRARFAGNDPTRIEWVYESGTEDNPLLSQQGSDWLWDTTVEKSGVSTLGVDEDATQVAAKAWTPGNGQEVDMILKSARDTTLVDTGFPWTEVDEAAKDIEDPAVVQSYADRLLADSLRPKETWSLTVDAATNPTLGMYQTGEWARVFVPKDHPIIEHGERRVRLMAIDGDGTNQVRLSIAPLRQSLTGPTGADTMTSTRPSDELLYPATTVYPAPKLNPLGNVNDFTDME